MNVERKHIGGIKAKYLTKESNTTQNKGEPLPVILIISPFYRRIALILNAIIEKAGKKLECHGVELYRQALVRLPTEYANRVVCLVITDRPDDCNSPSKENLPLWKAVIHEYQKNYLEAFISLIGKEIFPPSLTVITLFKSSKGKMSDEEIYQIQEEFEKLEKELDLHYTQCKSEEELKNTVDKQVVGMILERHRQATSVRNYERTRTQKIAKAKKITQDAWKKR